MQRQTNSPDPTTPGLRARRALLALAVVHPVPSVLNAVLVAVLVEAVSRLQGNGRCERLAIDADDQPAEIQERALSSSIWYTP